MASDFNLWLEKLKDNSDIVGTISRYVGLNKKGKTWWGNCPFHFEKTPSFAVNEIEQYYHCFGCGASGDVISFVSKFESLDFIESCEVLAKNANMQMPDFENNKNIVKDKKEKDAILKILRDTAIYFINNLRSGKYEVANKYIAKRKLDAETIKTFGIGYSCGWNELIVYLQKLGYSNKDIKLAGVADERDGKLYDSYAKRLIFPLINANNDVVGFSARLLEDADFAKYKNTAQTMVFDKSRVVYSINNIKKQKQNGELKRIILVEGQMDVISLYKNGVKNAVATLGTSLTPLHAKEIKKFTDKVVICFDGDSAGIKATLRSIDILNDAGLKVYVASLPDGYDPDDYIKKYGKEEFLNYMDNAKYWVEFLIYDFAKKYNMDKPDERTEFIINTMNVVKKLESMSEQNVYLEIIKKYTNVSMDVLRQDFLNKVDNIKASDVVTPTKTENNDSLFLSKENAYVKAVKFVVASHLHKKSYVLGIDIFKEYILNNDYKKILEYIQEGTVSNKPFSVGMLYNKFDMYNNNNQDIEEIAKYEFNDNLDNENYYKDCIKIIVLSGYKMEQSKLNDLLISCSTLDERREIAKKINDITIKIKNFKI